ncbi:MAG TPA: extensin, partial [Pseudolabrys sp.]|nr:extensin [Pseudolabrys sp.]
MKVGVGLSIVGAALLLALAGCGRSFFFGEREPWRHDAEVECLKSGVVKLGAGVVRMEPIEGPGMCGADFPLKVSALGES